METFSFTPFQRFLQQVTARPGAHALCCKEQYYTYSELWQQAVAIKEKILDYGRPALVGVCTGDDFFTYATMVGIWAAGAAYVPINAKSSPERNRIVVQEAGLNLVFYSEHEPDFIDKDKVNTVFSPALAASDMPPQSLPTGSDALAYLFFTSGSTGKPKGVPISQKALTAFFEAIEQTYALGAQDRFLQMFELTFDLSVFSWLAPLSVGGCCYVLPETRATYLNCADYLERYALTVSLMAPSVLRYLQRYFSELNFPELRYSLFCGEALYQNLVWEWSKCCPNAIIENVYGPTEATIFCTRYTWQASKDESYQGIVPIGKGLKGITPLIRNTVENNTLDLEPPLEGELLIAGAQLAEGYWQDEVRTSSAFITLEGERYYRTGDQVRVNAQGDLLFIGRIDNQIKIDGFRVEPGEIEFHLSTYFGGVAAVVFALTQTDAVNPTLVAVIEHSDLPVFHILDNYLMDRLPVYMRPRRYFHLPNFPLNLNGKIDRPTIYSWLIEQMKL